MRDVRANGFGRERKAGGEEEEEEKGLSVVTKRDRTRPVKEQSCFGGIHKIVLCFPNFPGKELEIFVSIV